MSDEAARPDEPARLVYAGAGSAMRLVEFAAERGRRTVYVHDDARGAVVAHELDGATTEYRVPPGRVLARTRHPETGAWVHVCLPETGAGTATPVWPTVLPGRSTEGATPALRSSGAPASPNRPPAVAGLSPQATTYTYDRDGRLINVRTSEGGTVMYRDDPDDRVTDPADEL
jgi:hypothetical protein